MTKYIKLLSLCLGILGSFSSNVAYCGSDDDDDLAAAGAPHGYASLDGGAGAGHGYASLDGGAGAGHGYASIDGGDHGYASN